MANHLHRTADSKLATQYLMSETDLAIHDLEFEYGYLSGFLEFRFWNFIVSPFNFIILYNYEILTI